MIPCFIFEKLLAHHCAPTLAGIKPASLVSCAKKHLPNASTILADYNALLNKRGIFIKTLFECDRRILLIVYHQQNLQAALSSKQIRSFLATVGYKNTYELEDTLSHLKDRIALSKSFPHEIGVFLGYPLQDVIGFIEHKGKHYKLCGYWKVYSDESHTAQLFEQYTACKHEFCARLNLGMSIREQLKIA